MNMLTPELIAEIRTSLGMTAEQFGRAVGVTGNTVFRWEQGVRHPTYKRAIKIHEIAKRFKPPAVPA